MALGLGLGMGLTRGGDLVINDAIVLATGQSLQDHEFSQFSGAGDTAFQAEAANYFSGTITHTDAAAINQYLTKSSYDASGDTGGRYYWDDTTEEGAVGPRYTAEVAVASNKDTYNAIKLDLGQSDGVNASFPHTKAEYKTRFSQLLAQYHSDFPNATILINPLNRTRATGDFNANYNLVRQVQLELIDELSYVQRGVETYHRVMTDNFHFVQSGVEGQSEDEARRIAYKFGKISSGALGPYITNLVDRTDRIEFDIVHDGGTDWTAPSSGYGMFGVEDDDTSIVPSSITKTSATKGVIVLPEGSAPLHGSTIEGFMNYGDGGDLAADPDAALDNATNPLPFRSAANIAVTSGDPIKGLDNLEFRMHARGCAKTYSSSNIIDTITSLAGSDFSVIGSGTGPEFTTNYIEFARNTDGIITDDVIATSAARTLGIVGKMPSTIPAFGTIAGFTNSSGVWSNNARAYIHTGGFLNYAAVTGGDTALHSSGAFTGGEDFTLFLRFNDATELEGFVNSITATATLSPQGTYAAAEKKLAFGEPSNQNGFALEMLIYDAFLTSDAITDQELSDIYDFWGEQFSLDFI